MAELKHEYTNRVYSDHGFYAAWPPIQRVRLGDFGTVDGRLFTPVGNVFDQFSLSSDLRAARRGIAGDADGVIHSQGASSFCFRSGATVEQVVQASAGLQVSFSTRHDFVVSLAGAQTERIEDVRQVMAALANRSHLSLKDPEYWDHGAWRVVTSIVHARNLTAIMSAGNNSSVVLQARGSGQVPNIPSIDLADVNLQLDITSGRIAGQRWVTKIAQGDPFTPFFGMHRVNWLGRFLGRDVVFAAAGEGDGSENGREAMTAVEDGSLGGVP